MTQTGLSLAVLCAGASLGAVARWQLGLWLNTPGSWLPAGTLVANLAGGYLVGVLVGVFNSHPGIDPVWRLALITGFLGALTTFSTFSAEAVHLLQAQRYAQALTHSAVHLFGSLALTWLGLRTAGVLAR